MEEVAAFGELVRLERLPSLHDALASRSRHLADVGEFAAAFATAFGAKAPDGLALKLHGALLELQQSTGRAPSSSWLDALSPFRSPRQPSLSSSAPHATHKATTRRL